MMAEAEGRMVLEFVGLLELAMAACWVEQQEEKRKKQKTAASSVQSIHTSMWRTTSKEMEPTVTTPFHGDKQRQKEVAKVVAAAGNFSPSGEKRKKTKSNPPYEKFHASFMVRSGWLQKAVQMGATRPELVLRKRMFATDLNPHHTRLLLPCAHRGDSSRGGVELLLRKLTAAESKAVLVGGGLPVTLLDRWGREYRGAALRRWPSNEWFVVNGGGAWMGVVEKNALRRGDVVDIFCFRASGPAGGAGGRRLGGLVLVVSTQVSVEEEVRRQREAAVPAMSPPKARKGKPVACSDEQRGPSQKWRQSYHPTSG